MENPTRFDTVRFQNVEFSAESVSLLDQQSKILTILKKDIRAIVLKYGFQSERPFVQVGFGLTLILIGLYFIANFILQLLINRIVYTTMLLSMLLLPVGIWFMLDGVRRSLYFEVALDNDRRKFPLGKNPDAGKLQEFIQATSRLGYVVDASIMKQPRRDE
jgi:hypothetical protein